MEPTPGMPAGGPPGSVQQAMNAVSAPAIALIIVGGIGVLGGLLSIFSGTLLAPMLEQLAQNDENLRQQMEQMRAQGFANSIGGVVGLAVSAFIVFGAIQMKGLKSYGLAVAASVLAFIPCLGPCCCLGIPFGIWSLVVLLKPEVKAGFEASARGATL